MADGSDLIVNNGGTHRRFRGVLSFFFVGILLISGLFFGWWWLNQYRAACFWKDAQEAIRAHDPRTGLEFLEKYVGLRPRDLDGLFLAARTSRRVGKFQQAKKFLARYEELGGNKEAILLERDLILVQQGVIGDVDRRLRSFVGPDHPEVLFVLEAMARGYVLAERWPDARQAGAMWRALAPDDPMAWFWGGWVCEKMVQVEQAVDFYKKALELDPNSRDIRVAVGRIQLRQRNPGEAAPNYAAVLEKNPEDEEALLGLARALIEQGQFSESATLVDRALVRNPGSSLAKSLKGRVEMEKGDARAAEPLLRETFAADPTDAESLHLLIRALRSQGKTQEADELDKRLTILRDDLKRLSDLLRKIGVVETDLGPRLEAAEIALRIGRKDQGMNLLEEALRMKVDHKPVHAFLARYYRQQGRLDLAEVQRKLAEKP